MSNADCTLTQEYLKSILRYDPETGLFTWAKKIPHSKSIAQAGGLCSQKYWRIKINKRSYKAHRLAWLYVYGAMPDGQIDHINGIRSDNRMVNLRQAQASDNALNRTLVAKSTSGMLGVTYRKTSHTYVARLQVNGKRITIGYYDCPQKALQAYLSKKAELSTFFNPTRI
jgi:hypothetical protein